MLDKQAIREIFAKKQLNRKKFFNSAALHTRTKDGTRMVKPSTLNSLLGKYLKKYCFALAAALTLSACGGGSENTSPTGSQTVAQPAPNPTPALTAATIIANLENNGQIPKLDRSASLAGPDEDKNSVRDDIDARDAEPGGAIRRTPDLRCEDA